MPSSLPSSADTALKPSWSIPSDRKKMDRDHHVPPSDRAVEFRREQTTRRLTSSFGGHPPYVLGGRLFGSGAELKAGKPKYVRARRLSTGGSIRA
jgi:hypothetical protein